MPQTTIDPSRRPRNSIPDIDVHRIRRCEPWCHCQCGTAACACHEHPNQHEPSADERNAA